MTLIPLVLTLVLAWPGLAPPQPAQDPPPPAKVLLRHVPAATDTGVTYTFVEESALAVDHLRSTMNGGVFEREAPDRSVKQVARRVWVDTPLTDETGSKLRRSFVELSASMEVTSHRDGEPRPDGTAAATSALAGSMVEFTDTGGGVPALLPDEDVADGTEADDALPPEFPPPQELGALVWDCSLQGFLPPGGEAVPVGEEWAVDAAAMLGVFAPGGDLATYYGAIQNQQDPDVIARFGGHAVSRFGSGVSGDVQATLLGSESRDGRRLARVQVRFDVTLVRDPADWMQAQSTPFEMAKIGQSAKNASHSLTVAGEGTLLWDLDHHRFVEFAATAQTTSDQRLDYEFEYMATVFSGEEHFELSGTTTLKISAEYAGP